MLRRSRILDCGLRIVDTARSEGERERRRESEFRSQEQWKNVGRRKESVHSPQAHLKYKFLSTSQFACAKDFISTLVVKGTSIV